MKKNVYFITFIVLQSLMALLFLYDYTIGLLFSGLVMLYELFYIMVIYKSSDRKNIKILTFLVIFLFLGYEFLSKDPSNLVVLLFMFFNSLFIFSYFKENNINKRVVIDLFRYMYPVMCILFYLFGYYLEFAYFLVVIYPLLFINLNKSKLDILLIYLCTFLLLLFRENIFTYYVMSYLTVLTLYYSFNRHKKSLEAVLPLLIITILVSVSLEGSVIYHINSRVFENELLIIKFVKAFVGLFPMMYYVSFYMLKVREKKYKISNDIFVILLSIIGYLALILYTRLDIPCIIVTVSSLLFVTLYKLQCSVGKKTSDKALVLVDKLDTDKVNMIDEISKSTKVICTFNNGVKNSLDVKYIIEDKRKKKPEGLFIKLINSCKERCIVTEYLYNDNSKYLIAFSNKLGELINEYGNINARTIVFFDDKDYDSEHVLSVSRTFKDTDYIIFESKKMEEVYKDKLKAKCMLFDKNDRKQLNNLLK